MTPLKNKGYIYKVTNIITGQFYIGQRSSYTGSPEDDLGVHYFTSSKVVRPLFKNNTSEWQKEILYRDIQYAETLDDMEGYAIHKEIKDSLCMNRYDPTIYPGFSTAGKCHSEETKAKIRQSLIGHSISSETRAKMRQSLRGRSVSSETKARMSEAQRGKCRSAETRAKIREAWNHRAPVSAETKAKLSEAQRGKHLSDETRAKIRQSLIGHSISSETRARMSEAQRARR